MRISSVIVSMIRPIIEFRASGSELCLLIGRKYDDSRGIPYRRVWPAGFHLSTGAVRDTLWPPSEAARLRIGDFSLAIWSGGSATDYGTCARDASS